MQQKIRVGVLFGGKSAEHEVSLLSAINVVRALSPDKYEVVLIGIDKQGKWYTSDYNPLQLTKQQALTLSDDPENLSCLISNGKNPQIVNLKNLQTHAAIDVIFPVLHGTYGEDGTVQGLLKLAGVPFVGSDVLGSAVCMDKDISKRLLQQASLPIVNFMVLRSSRTDAINIDEIIAKIGLPCFIKPANLGSSIGIRKVKTKKDLLPAINYAFLYDSKILIEQSIPCREIECAVLGNDEPIASGCAEIVPQHEFYTYEAKYLDENGAKLIIPANIPTAISEKIRSLAVEAFQILNCSGMARVDFFLDKETHQIYINELNTIPGFTKISMYPQLWQACGISYEELIDKLIMLALEKFDKDQSLLTDYQER